jgi:glycosyltransferase involved in cell wall biosynthesis
MTSYRVLVVTNLWPYEGDPSYGCFVKAQMDSLRPFGVDYEVMFINGRESRWNYLRAYPQLWRRLRAKRYDLIHAHMGLSGLVARCQFRVPVLVTFHGHDVTGEVKRSGRITLLGRFFQVSSFILARLVLGIIVQNRAMRSMLGVKSARVIPCGIDSDVFRPMDLREARRKLGLDLDKKYVLFPYSPAEERKRYDVVEAVVARAREQVPELEILHALGVPNDRMPFFMNAADVVVLASISEGSPVAVKEALATNLPVVTVDVGDTPDLLEGTAGNYLVPRDVDAMAEKVVEVCRRGRRSNSRESIVRRQSLEQIAEQIVDLYASILKRRD